MEAKWRVMQVALADSAAEGLGKEKKQPTWFQDSKDHLRPYHQARNSTYTKWLANNKRQDLVKFREGRSKAR